MKKLLTTILFLSLAAFAAKGKTATATADSDKAILHVTAKDYKDRIYKGETIQFVGRTSKITIEGKTDANGSFDAELPRGETYDILFQSLSGPYNCGEVKVPANAGEGTWTVQF